MKILHFSKTYSPHDHRFLSKMVETGNEIFYLSLEGAATSYEDRPLPAGVTQLRWSQLHQEPTWQDGSRMVADLKEMIQTHNFDIIQAGPVQRAAFLVTLTGFKNLVTMSWGYDLLIDLQRGPAWRWATRRTLRRSAAFVGDCRTIRDIAVENGMPAEKIVTFPWGADIRTYVPPPGPRHETELRRRRGWGPDTFVLLSTRGWTELYGVEQLIAAFTRLSGKYPQLRLFMLGNGPLAGRIQGAVGAAGLNDRVHFPGLIPQEALPAYYQAADLYVSTSHSDGTSISLLEALASGTPVLLRDIPGNREWTDAAEKIGWLFEDGGLAGAIEAALEQREELPRMGMSARALAEARGDWDRNFPELGKAWQIALDG